MRIEDAKVIVTCPGRNFVTLKITTDDGLTGIGDATLNGREKAVVAYLEEHVVPSSSATRGGSRTRGRCFYRKGAYWRRGSGHDARHRGGGRGALGHQGQGRGDAALRSTGRQEPRWRDGLRPRQRRRCRGDGRRGRALSRLGYRRARAGRRRGSTSSTACPATRCSTSRRMRRCQPRPSGRPANTSTTRRSCSSGCGAAGFRLRAPARRPPPA